MRRAHGEVRDVQEVGVAGGQGTEQRVDEDLGLGLRFRAEESSVHDREGPNAGLVDGLVADAAGELVALEQADRHGPRLAAPLDEDDVRRVGARVVLEHRPVVRRVGHDDVALECLPRRAQPLDVLLRPGDRDLGAALARALTARLGRSSAGGDPARL